jgi:hypothetical protein
MNNLPHLPLIDGCLPVDNSHWMDPLQTCDRLLEYESLRGRISTGEATALNFGTAQHLTREYRYKVYRDQPLDQAYFNGCADILSSFFNDHPSPVDDFRSLNWAIEVSRQYDKRWSKENFRLMRYEKSKVCDHCGGIGENCYFCGCSGGTDMMVELSFIHRFHLHKLSNGLFHLLTPEQRKWVIELGGIWILYCGRIDLPIVIDNRIWVMDFKTTSILGEVFWNRMKMSSQQKGYCWAFKELTGKDVAGYIVRAIRTKEPPKYVVEGTTSRGGKTQSPEQWWEESLQENREYVSNEKLNDWKQNTIELIEKMFWQYERGFFPMSTESCTKWGRCQYFDVCQMLPAERLVVLNSGLFKSNDWSPLKQPTQCQPLITT